MAPRKKVVQEEQPNLPQEQLPAVAPQEGELLVNMNVGTAVGRIITAGQAGIAEIEQAHTALIKHPDLVEYAGTIEGNAALKGYIKQCTSLRSALDRAHKDAKAPFLEATRALDAKLKECKEAVLLMEAPAKQALADYDNKQAALAKQAQDARVAELEAEVAALRGRLEEENVIPPFEDKQIVITVRGRQPSQDARNLFGDDAYDEVKTDERGVNYTLEVVLRRKEIQNA